MFLYGCSFNIFKATSKLHTQLKFCMFFFVIYFYLYDMNCHILPKSFPVIFNVIKFWEVLLCHSKKKKKNIYFRKCLEDKSWQFKFYCVDLIVGLQKQFSLLTNKNNGVIRSLVNQNIKFRQEKKNNRNIHNVWN